MSLDPINFEKDNNRMKREKDLQHKKEERVRAFRDYPRLRKVGLWQEWLELRRATGDFGDRICYCGHTFKCECADPDFECFCSSVLNGSIILNDPKNGWSHNG